MIFFIENRFILKLIFKDGIFIKKSIFEINKNIIKSVKKK